MDITATNIFMLLAIILGIMSVFILFFTLRSSTKARFVTKDRIFDLLNVDSAPLQTSSIPFLDTTLKRIGALFPSITTPKNDSLPALLNKAGIYRLETRITVQGIFIISPIIGLIFGISYASTHGQFDATSFSAIGFFCIGGYLLPRYALKYKIQTRQKGLGDDAFVMIHLLKMLFDSGLYVEQSLRTLHDQGATLLPYLHPELGRLLRKIDAGMDRSDAIEEWGTQIGVLEIVDVSDLLTQICRQGGNIQKSLEDMATLIEDKRRTSLRERVGRVSGKMTVVMVVFLFPALMIFLAGPGIISIMSALGGIK